VKKYLTDLKNQDLFDSNVKRYKLPNENIMDYDNYFVTFEEKEGFLQRTVQSTDNNLLTIWFLFKQLCFNVKKYSIKASFYEKHRKYIDIIIKETNMGDEAISIIPIYLGHYFGVIVDFHFRLEKGIISTREIQKLSLSLDSSGKPNKNYYSDKYEKIELFINSSMFKKLNLFSGTPEIFISSEMLPLKGSRLAAKKYLFCNGNIDVSQFKGIEKYGPFLPYSNKPVLCFVYRNQDKELSYALYYALLGKTYPTFNGMEKMFGFSMNKDSVIGISVNDYTELEITNLINHIKIKTAGKSVIPIVLVPWIKETATKEQSELYYMMKHHFLKENIPSQFVGIPRVKNYESLKWSVSSIGLQIFTKLGGSPWCMEAETNNCLIIGIGQSHKFDINRNVEKYYSYSIMTDSSGLFKNIKVLSENVNEKEYLNGLSNKLNDLIEGEIDNYDNFVIHTSFRLRNKEVEKINEVVENFSKILQKEFVVIRFSDDHHYMGFNIDANSKTPFESTIVSLNKKEYLVWFEGLSSATKTVKTRIGAPMHLTIDFAKSYQYTDIYAYLQDAINLSGANWRGFNAKTTPVSILYAHLLSSFLAAFDRYSLEKIDIEQLTPWFL
jgi:hypothetical protein